MTQSLFTSKHVVAALVIAGGVFSFSGIALATPLHKPEVQVIDTQTQAVDASWLAFDETYSGGLAVATGDVDGDGKQEVIVAQSGGADAHGVVKIFTGTGTLIAHYPLFAEDITGSEISLATGNLDSDKADEIVVGLSSGSRGMVYIFDGKLRFDSQTIGAFDAFPGIESGVHVAIANVVGDKKDEIVVGSGAGTEPLIKIFNAQGKSVAKDIVPFAEEDQDGVTIARLHHTTGFDDIAVGLAAGSTAVKQYRFDTAQTYPVVNQTAGWSREFISGVSLAGFDKTGDGQDEVALTPAGDQLGEVKVIDNTGKSQLSQQLVVYEDDFRGGVGLAVGQLDKDTQPEYVIVPRAQKKHADPARAAKYIEVNLSTQVESLWEDGYLRNVFLISSGLPRTPSPEGEFSILKKIAVHVYDGRPAYYFPNTPWNLRYKTGNPENYYFHTAYWHNNFGHPMSHGCINMREADAKFLYFWADLGTPAWLHK